MSSWLASVLHDFAQINVPAAAAIFVGYIVLDALYALYTLAVARQQAARSATLSSTMYFLMAAGVLAYTANIAYLVPAAAGSWLGTYAAVRRSTRQTVE